MQVNRPNQKPDATKSFAELWERHPLKIIGSAVAVGFTMGVGFVTYAWLPSQTMELRRQLDDCTRGGRQAQPTTAYLAAPSTPLSTPSVRRSEQPTQVTVLPPPSGNPLESPLQLEAQFKA